MSKIWISQCEEAKQIEVRLGPDKALAYLVGEKFINFLGVAEEDETWQREVPAFSERIRKMFDTQQLSDFSSKK